MTDTISTAEAVAIVSTLHSDTLALQPADVTSERADAVVNGSNTQTTTELLLLLAKFHSDVEDQRAADMLAAFAVQFAAYESTVI